MIPLGGYVQMLESKNADGNNNEIKESDYKFCFDKKNVYQRFAIVAAGPIFNLILAVVFFTLTYLNGIGGIKPKINLMIPIRLFLLVEIMLNDGKMSELKCSIM